MIPIENVFKILDFEFERIVNLFSTETWKFYKFGQGGPHKRELTRLTKFANEMDLVIFENFGEHEENASFSKLIVLCLSISKDANEHSIIDFRNQLKRMRKQL